MQLAFRKLKSQISKKEHKRFYSTMSKLGMIYGRARLSNLQKEERLKGVASYETIKCLNTLLTLLTKSQYNVPNAKDLIRTTNK